MCRRAIAPYRALGERELATAATTSLWSGCAREFTERDVSSYRSSVSHHRVIDPASRRRPWKLPIAGLEARRLAAKLRPDIVHGLYLSGYGWTAHDFGVHPLVLSALGTDVLDLDPERSRSATA